MYMQWSFLLQTCTCNGHFCCQHAILVFVVLTILTTFHRMMLGTNAAGLALPAECKLFVG